MQFDTTANAIWVKQVKYSFITYYFSLKLKFFLFLNLFISSSIRFSSYFTGFPYLKQRFTYIWIWLCLSWQVSFSFSTLSEKTPKFSWFFNTAGFWVCFVCMTQTLVLSAYSWFWLLLVGPVGPPGHYQKLNQVVCVQGTIPTVIFLQSLHQEF